MSVLGKIGKKLHDRDKVKQAKKRGRATFDPSKHIDWVSIDGLDPCLVTVQVYGNPDRFHHYIASMMQHERIEQLDLCIHTDIKESNYDDLSKAYHYVFKQYYNIQLRNLAVIYDK